MREIEILDNGYEYENNKEETGTLKNLKKRVSLC